MPFIHFNQFNRFSWLFRLQIGRSVFVDCVLDRVDTWPLLAPLG
jgi:hypothetical protein